VPSENFINFRLMSAMCAISLHLLGLQSGFVYAKVCLGGKRTAIGQLEHRAVKRRLGLNCYQV